MYNGIGLTTARGSGTSGHVTKNLSYVKPEFFRNKLDSNSGRNRTDDSRSNAPKISGGNRDILEHNKKRAVEARLFALQESLVEQGFTDVEIAEKIARQRQELNDTGTETTKTGKVSGSDSHSIAIRKQEEMVRARNAFGIKDDFVAGEAFDPEVQERKKREREERRAERGDRERGEGGRGGGDRSRRDRERDVDRHGDEGRESRYRDSHSRRERSRSRDRDRNSR